MSADSRFRWHPSARVAGADGVLHGAGTAMAMAVIPDDDGVAALQSAFAAASAGLVFRIGPAQIVPPNQTKAAPAFETLTGGSTGTPRRILRTQASWIASFQINARLFGIGPGCRVAVLGRLAHSIALYAGVEALHLGADLHLLAGRSLVRQAGDLRLRGIDVLYATPVQLRLLTDAATDPIPGLRHVIAGGGALDLALRARLASVFPEGQVHGFYGAAETSFIALSGPGTPEGVTGAPYPGVEIALRDVHGAPATKGPALIWVRSPYLALGYACPDPGGAIWQDGWVSVGEWGQVTAGQLTVLGRADRMVRIADQSVFPEGIEAFLLAQPGVQDAAIIARPDSRRGHVLIAVCRGDSGVTSALMDAARARFGAMAAPRAILWRADWPLLSSGKVDLARIAADLP